MWKRMRLSRDSKLGTASLRGEKKKNLHERLREKSEMWERQEKVGLWTPKRRDYQEKHNDQQCLMS